MEGKMEQHEAHQVDVLMLHMRNINLIHLFLFERSLNEFCLRKEEVQ